MFFGSLSVESDLGVSQMTWTRGICVTLFTCDVRIIIQSSSLGNYEGEMRYLYDLIYSGFCKKSTALLVTQSKTDRVVPELT